ncbi:MAG: elongation factor P [Patescibacteria group bacterium]
MLDINDLKRAGTIIQIDGQPYSVVESQHARAARGRAFVRTKLRNLISGATLEKTFNASDRLEEADVERIKANFLYKDGEVFVFMENKNYEQFSLPQKILGGQEKFLKDNTEATLVLFNRQPIHIELPKKIELKVISAPPGIKGNTASGASKVATLETGLDILVPLFINEGDIVRINTETGEYSERV